jgi:hypothetical protein
MNTNLTDIAISALVATPITIATAIVLPQYVWLLGVVLILLGIVTAVKTFLDWGDAEDCAVGMIVAIFGLLTEIASIDGLVYLTIFAIIVDAVVGLVEHFS